MPPVSFPCCPTMELDRPIVLSLPKNPYLYPKIRWIIAMQQMCVGDKWEVYIPAEMGYGKFSQPGIPGGSTLIFEIELFGIA